MSRLNKSEMPSLEYLNECFIYEKDTGKLFWKERPRHHFKDDRAYISSNKRFSGKQVDAVCREYIRLCLNGKSFYAHRIAWKMATGAEPLLDIDHINGNTVDNRFCNL